MDLESKLSEIIQLLLSAHQNKKTPLQLHNDLFARLNTFVYISQDPNLAQIPDTTTTLVYNALDSLKGTLEEIEEKEDGLLNMAKHLFQNSPLKKLELMVTRLLRISDQMIQDLTVQKYIDHKINQKRRLTSIASNDVEEIEAKCLMSKKIKGNSSVSTALPEVEKWTETKFNIKVICHPKLDQYLPLNERSKTSFWIEDMKEDIFVIKRDDYLKLPNDLIVKISKEHAKLRGWKKQIQQEDGESLEETKMKEEIGYQIIDSSINGTYYLGNINEGFSKQRPMKLKGGIPFQLRHGDRIGILMDKEPKTIEMLVGLEFSIAPKKEDQITIE